MDVELKIVVVLVVIDIMMFSVCGRDLCARERSLCAAEISVRGRDLCARERYLSVREISVCERSLCAREISVRERDLCAREISVRDRDLCATLVDPALPPGATRAERCLAFESGVDD